MTVVGTNAAVVNGGDAGQTLDVRSSANASLNGFRGPCRPGMTMDEAVAAFLRERGRDQVELRMYSAINSIIKELDPEPGAALRDLAAIDDLRLFVSTTPDRLLAKALNEARFQGRPRRARSRFPRISPPASRRSNQKRLRRPIPSCSVCSVNPPPRRSMRSTRKTGWSGSMHC